MTEVRDDELSSAELRILRRLAGLMVPYCSDYQVPGADDERIFADIVASLGRDRVAVAQAIAELDVVTGGKFADLDEERAELAAEALLARADATTIALGRAVLQCYYRDDRVIRSLGLEPRAPFPAGHVLEPGDWALLDAVKGRARMWRDVVRDDLGGRDE